MFNNHNKKMESIIGKNSDISGELNVSGTLRIDGMVRGKLNAECVIVSESAMVKGDIKAKTIIVGGKVEGNLIGEEMIEIKPKGAVLGEIFTNKFFVIEGGTFNGRVQMRKDESNVIPIEPKAQES
ncbi:MAG: polymer-forming cytoskeletal protein [Deltaproteobacteria bacterium]|jgi:cytoskeletal protein CcmA (bactofilin family)|nr:polymer-forming cytoskeletal protein [Deltaproteobacteria bacterium]